MDAREATRIVRDYFRDANGEYGSIGFQVESVERAIEEEASCWLVTCSFFRSLMSPERNVFLVRVAESGDIEKVTKLPETIASVAR